MLYEMCYLEYPKLLVLRYQEPQYSALKRKRSYVDMLLSLILISNTPVYLSVIISVL